MRTRRHRFWRYETIAETVGWDVSYGVGQSVSAKIAVPSEHLSARVALVRFVVRVGQQVRLQVRTLIEGSAADRTLVRRFLHVQDLVDCQSPRLAESFAAFRTFERLLFTMNIPMVSEMVLPPEGLAADVAGVWPLVRVRPLVDEKVVALGELSVAEFADELFLGSGGTAGRPQQPPIQVGVHLGWSGREESGAAGERERGVAVSG